MEQSYLAVFTAIDSFTSYRKRYEVINKLFCQRLQQLTANVPFVFAGPYAMIVYLCQRVAYGHLAKLNALRLHCHAYHKISEEQLEKYYKADLESLRMLLTLEVTAGDKKTSKTERVHKYQGKRLGYSERVSILKIKSLGEVVVMISGKNSKATADLSAFDYLEPHLHNGTMLNLIQPEEKDGLITPRNVVYEPDYLVDVTSIARCFSPYADTHELNMLSRLRRQVVTHQILLGNIAGHFLDEQLEALRNGDTSATEYNPSARRFFRKNLLEFTACKGIDAAWHEEAKNQQRNVREMFKTLQCDDPNFDVRLAQTEPSFLSEPLGIQGRMDLLQSDYRLLIEQKSGKMNWLNNNFSHREEHYVQMVIYQMLLNASLGVEGSCGSQYLFYSKYSPDKGLIREGVKPAELISQIYEMRNMITIDEMRYCNSEEIKKDLLGWTPNHFRQKRVGDKFWYDYIEPQIKDVLRPIQNAPTVMQEYLFAMLGFIHRESLYNRLGTSAHVDRGLSSLWSLSANDRRASGEMMDELLIVEMRATDRPESDVVDYVVVRRSDGEAQISFRVGDTVLVYDYDDEPDVRYTTFVRGVVAEVGGDGAMGIKLRSSQSRRLLTESENRGRRWVVERDKADFMTEGQLRSVVSLLDAPAERQALLLGTRKPIVSDEAAINGDYGEMNEMVRRVACAREMFLLVGPPGTGKTSLGLVSILKEELSHAGHSVLLTAYTNRAVDEICSKLEKESLDYIRVGTLFACDEQYRERLLDNMEFATIKDVAKRLQETRIIVGTTAWLASHSALLSVKHFELAIVDEASQILEHGIVGLFSQTNGEGLERRVAVDRFVLIGDHNQLPAVTLQPRQRSKIDNETLREIGVTDLRDSFFERMIRLLAPDGNLDTPYSYTLTRQGRMHPETAQFVNEHYYNNQLTTVPLAHQVGDLAFACPADATEFMQQIATKRCLFIDSYRAGQEHEIVLDEKSNEHEAAIITEVVRCVFALRRDSANSLKTIGVVVPYRNQIATIRRHLLAVASDEERRFMSEITIDTVERYQGSERDVIVYGFTVHSERQLRFLRDTVMTRADGVTVDRKLNVALSRAREQLIIVGNRRIIGGLLE